jgi:hypothetical protein
MSVQMTAKAPSPSSEDIATAESQLGVRLPEAYREFVASNNIAKPEANQYRTERVTTSVDHFFGISNIQNDDLVAQNELYAGRLPKRMLAIAQAGGGNLICLSAVNGMVFFWDHEREATEDEEPGFENMERLAPSFQEFLKRLQPFRPEDFPSTQKVVSVNTKPGFAEKFKKYM